MKNKWEILPCPIISYLSEGVLPKDSEVALKIIVQAHYMQWRMGPCEYKESNGGALHCSYIRSVPVHSYNTMLHQWWDRMYQHIINCPQCAIATDVRRRQSPSLKSTPVDHPLCEIGGCFYSEGVHSPGNQLNLKLLVLFTDPLIWSSFSALKNFAIIYPSRQQLPVFLSRRVNCTQWYN